MFTNEFETFTGRIGATKIGLTVTRVEVDNAPALTETVVVPAETAVKSPVVELIVPTAVFELTKFVLVENALPN